MRFERFEWTAWATRRRVGGGEITAPPRRFGAVRHATSFSRLVYHFWTSIMKFIVQWKGMPAVQQAAIERFLKTGARPPDNVTMLGRWHSIGELSGVGIVEATDASALVKWTLQWSDLFSFTTTPALTDEELGAALAAHQAAAG